MLRFPYQRYVRTVCRREALLLFLFRCLVFVLWAVLGPFQRVAVLTKFFPLVCGSMASAEGEAGDQMQQSLAHTAGGMPSSAPAHSFGPGVGAEEVIKQWKIEKASLARRKKELSKQIRNETRKRSRLREKARKLSNDDLLKVLYSRQQAADMKNSARTTRSH